MTVTISGKEYILRVGIKCLEYLDKAYYAEAEGLKVGFGVELLTVALQTRNPVGLFNAIKGGVITERGLPSDNAIEDCIEMLIENDKFEDTCDDFLSALETAPLTKRKMQSLQKLTDEETTTEKKSKKSATTK